MCGGAQSLRDYAPLPDEVQDDVRLTKRVNPGKEKKTQRIRGAKPAVNNELRQLMTKFDQSSLPQGVARCNMPAVKLGNTSHGREKIKDGKAKFNVKSDRLSYGVLEKGAIQIISRQGKRCEMADFELDNGNSPYMHFDGNVIRWDVSAIDVALGRCPMVHKFTITHIKSGAKHTYDLRFSFPNYFNTPGRNAVLTLAKLPDDSVPNLALLRDQELAFEQVVSLPLLISANGANGMNGMRGTNGSNGKDELSWTDKDGKTHHTKGTCAQAGGDGGDATSGQNAGHVVIYIDSELMAMYGTSSVNVQAIGGKGGKGGEPGKGGVHGRGSGCSGRAADGKRGADGVDGNDGDYVLIEADLHNWLHNTVEKGGKL